VGTAAAASEDRPEHEPEESASGHAKAQHDAILAATTAPEQPPCETRGQAVRHLPDRADDQSEYCHR
jgi:hypothetical protein